MWYSPYYMSGAHIKLEPVPFSAIYFCGKSVNVFSSTHQAILRGCLQPLKVNANFTAYAKRHTLGSPLCEWEQYILGRKKWARMLPLINYVIIKLPCSSNPRYFILPLAGSLVAFSAVPPFSGCLTCKMLTSFDIYLFMIKLQNDLLSSVLN